MNHSPDPARRTERLWAVGLSVLLRRHAHEPLPPTPAVELFDGVCNLCNGVVSYLTDRAPKLQPMLRQAAVEGGAADAKE